MRFAANVEFGPGRHGPGHALFVYLRDPDGHRIELFNTHYQVMDIENEPVRWDASVAMQRRWPLLGVFSFKPSDPSFLAREKPNRRLSWRGPAGGWTSERKKVSWLRIRAL